MSSAENKLLQIGIKKIAGREIFRQFFLSVSVVCLIFLNCVIYYSKNTFSASHNIHYVKLNRVFPAQNGNYVKYEKIKNNKNKLKGGNIMYIRRRQKFTLIELLVVIAIIAIILR